MFGRNKTGLVVLLFCGGLINYMDRAVIGILAPAMRTDLGLDASEFGLVMSAFAVGYTIFSLVGGWAADRFGAQRMLIGSMTSWSFLCGLTGAVSGFVSLLLVRVGFGACEAPWMSSFNKVLGSSFPRGRFASVHGLCSSGQALGGVAAGPIVGGVAAILGWRAGFWAVAIIGFVWAAFWYFLIMKRPAPTEIAQAPSEASDEAQSKTPLFQLLTHPSVLAVTFTLSAATYFLAFFYSWFPSYMSDRFQLSIAEVGVLSTVPWLLGAVGMAVGGFAADALIRMTGSALMARRLLLIACTAVVSLAVFAVPFASTSSAALTLMSLAVGAMFLAGSTHFGIAVEVVPFARFGVVSGFMLFFANLAAVAAPALTGHLIETTGSYADAFSLAGYYLAAAMVVGILAIRPKKKLAGTPVLVE